MPNSPPIPPYPPTILVSGTGPATNPSAIIIEEGAVPPTRSPNPSALPVTVTGSGLVIPLNGDVIGPSNANTVIKWEGVPLDATTMGAPPTDGVPVFNGTAWEAEPLPVGAIAPGPQISYLRSVPATAPTEVVWASSGVVDFIFDCGADPTGIADCSGALNTAFDLLKALAANPKFAETTVELFVPPGIYLVTGFTAIWNFIGATTTRVAIRGCYDASIFALQQGLANDFLTVSNAFEFVCENLSFVGTSNVTANITIDTDYLFNTSQQFISVFRNCRFLNLNLNGAIIECEDQICRIENCQFAQSAVAVPNSAMVITTASLDLVDCRFEDIARLNGFSFTSVKVSYNANYVNIVGAQQTGHSIRRCFFDEGCQNSVVVTGDNNPPSNGHGTVPRVTIEDCWFNQSTHGQTDAHMPPFYITTTAVIQATYVFRLVIKDTIINTATAISGEPFALLSQVADTRIENVTFTTGTLSTWITADATCRLIRAEEIQPLNAQNIGFFAPQFYDGTAGRSLALSNQLQTFGTDTVVEALVLLTDARGSDIGSVMKAVSVGGVIGLTKIATTDAPGIALAIALDVAAASVPVRAAKRGQQVTMLSDGTTNIAIGDPVTNFGAGAAGQVLKAVATGTTPILGTAATAAVSGGGPVLFDAFFEYGEA
jgi:hypothetical protein